MQLTPPGNTNIQGSLFDFLPILHTDSAEDPFSPIDGHAHACLQQIFENKVIRFCLKNGMVKEETIMIMMQWSHTGFSVYTDSRMDMSFALMSRPRRMRNRALDLRYVAKPFFSQQKVVLQEGADRVLYKGDWHPKGTSSLRSRRTTPSSVISHPRAGFAQYFSLRDFLAKKETRGPGRN